MDEFILPNRYPVTGHTDHVGPGSTFVAIKGQKEHGIMYIPLALAKGATKIVIDYTDQLSKELELLIRDAQAEVIRVANTRKALAVLSAQAYNYPAQKLKIIGITGTKGKTSSAFILEHMLREVWHTALLSTVYNKILDCILPTDLTTQHPDYVHMFFNQCVQYGIEYVVMEVAAQALSLQRVYGIAFDAILFTNFSSEHAEFYNNIEEYFAAKKLIFGHAKSGASIFLNADDEWCQKILEEKNYQTFGIEHKSDVMGKRNESDFIITTSTDMQQGTHPLFGSFNDYNVLGAIAIAQAIGIPLAQLMKILTSFTGIPGRLEIHQLSNGAQCFIDYAHNPSSFEAVLSTLRECTSHLIVVFGCGGERDHSKRPIMGKIAAHYSDIVILTSDNPRSEDPQNIVDDIKGGIDQQYRHKVHIELDREQAIKLAYTLSKPTSIIALLGKGPDEYQLINENKYYFSEKEIIQRLE